MNPATAPTGLARRVTDEVYRILHARIVSGDMPPGTRVDIEALVREFDVSRTPVREAVLQLEAAGLVERQPYRGSVVTGVDPGRLDEVAALRYELEGLAAELGALRLSADDLDRMERILDEIDRRAAEPDYTSEVFNHLNREFHAILYAAADAPSLARLIQQLGVEADRMRAHFPSLADFSRADHRAVLAACRRRDAAGAGEAMRQHIRRAYLGMVGDKSIAGGVFDAVLGREAQAPVRTARQ